jgi:hypothetical protein
MAVWYSGQYSTPKLNTGGKADLVRDFSGRKALLLKSSNARDLSLDGMGVEKHTVPNPSY